MTVPANQPNRWEYTGDGSTDTFAYASRIFAASDLVVYVDGASQSTGFSVTGVGVSTGGNVVFDTAPADKAEITIVRDVPEAQPSSLPLGGSFPSTTVEQELDRLAIIAQQLEARISRTLRYPDSEQGVPSTLLPSISSLDGKFITFDGTGAPVVATEVDLGAALTPSDPITWTGKQTFQGNNVVECVELDDGSALGPIVKLFRDSASPATDDFLAGIEFEGRSQTATRVLWAKINAAIKEVAQDRGQLDFLIRIGTGGETSVCRMHTRGTIPQVEALWFDDGATEGPYIGTRKRSTTPAAADLLGAVVWDGHDSDLVTQHYFKIRGKCNDPTAGAVSGEADFTLKVAGTDTHMMGFRPTRLELGTATIPVRLEGGLERSAGETVVLPEIIDETTISSNQTEYTVTWTKAYKKIEVLVSRFRPAVDDTPTLRTSTDGGSTYDSGASDYQWTLSAGRTGGTAGAGDIADSEIELHDNTLEADDGNSASYRFLVIDPGNANSNTAVLFWGSVFQANGAYSNVWGQGQRLAEADVDGLRLAFATQQIAEAQIRVIGYF